MRGGGSGSGAIWPRLGRSAGLGGRAITGRVATLAPLHAVTIFVINGATATGAPGLIGRLAARHALDPLMRPAARRWCSPSASASFCLGRERVVFGTALAAKPVLAPLHVIGPVGAGLALEVWQAMIFAGRLAVLRFAPRRP